jgi:parvulin-like peptidyl-prolyl isomerase
MSSIAASLLRIAAAGLGIGLASTSAAAAEGKDPPAPVAAASAARPAAAPAVFATVGDSVITLVDYQRAYATALRKKYYHAKPPEAELPAFQREVGDKLVNDVLLLTEARRRGLKPDAAKIATTVAGYDKQYANSPNWQTGRATMLANVVPQLERDNLLEQIERQARTVPEPTDAVARAYYEQNKDKFVEPEQVKLSVILLKVDPSSLSAVWKGADEEGKRIHAKLKAGADFGELARLHSGDRSAAQGGQMEYTHRGMLPEAVQKVVEPLKPGELSEPVRLLEGVSILRLDGRRAAQQRSFEDVKARAGDLWQRAEGEARYKQLIAQLRRTTTVRIDESRYAPLPSATGDKPGAS